MANTGKTALSTHDKVRRLTVCAMLTALIWILAFTPIGFTLPFFGISMTFIHVPAIIGTLMEGLGCGSILGAMFGLSSLYNSFTRPTYFAPLFQNPLCSVLPRLLIAPATHYALVLAQKLLPGKKRLCWAIAAAAGTIANTVFTLSALSISVALNPGAMGLDAASAGGAQVAIWGAAVNMPFECATSIIISVAVMSALDKYYHKDKKVRPAPTQDK